MYLSTAGREDGGTNSRSPDGKIRESEIYFAGVIDILQQYNNVKKVENFFKVPKALIIRYPLI